MLTLGPYTFELSTAAWQSLERQTAWQWAVQERAGRVPARQFTGPGDDRLTIEGTVYPLFRGGLGQIDRLREEAGTGLPHLLIDGRGRVLGKWVVEAVNERQTHPTRDGTPKRIDFTLTLAAYGEDA